VLAAEQAGQAAPLARRRRHQGQQPEDERGLEGATEHQPQQGVPDHAAERTHEPGQMIGLSGRPRYLQLHGVGHPTERPVARISTSHGAGSRDHVGRQLRDSAVVDEPAVSCDR
jgi:hypothetical protein